MSFSKLETTLNNLKVSFMFLELAIDVEVANCFADLNQFVQFS